MTCLVISFSIFIRIQIIKKEIKDEKNIFSFFFSLYLIFFFQFLLIYLQIKFVSIIYWDRLFIFFICIKIINISIFLSFYVAKNTFYQEMNEKKNCTFACKAELWRAKSMREKNFPWSLRNSLSFHCLPL